LTYLAECLETLIINSVWFIEAYRTGKKTIMKAWENLNSLLTTISVTAEHLGNFMAPPTQLTYVAKTKNS
jgi:hypothetical protein